MPVSRSSVDAQISSVYEEEGMKKGKNSPATDLSIRPPRFPSRIPVSPRTAWSIDRRATTGPLLPKSERRESWFAVRLRRGREEEEETAEGEDMLS